MLPPLFLVAAPGSKSVDPRILQGTVVQVLTALISEGFRSIHSDSNRKVALLENRDVTQRLHELTTIREWKDSI